MSVSPFSQVHEATFQIARTVGPSRGMTGNVEKEAVWGVGPEEPWVVAFAHFCGVDPPTEADFTLLLCSPALESGGDTRGARLLRRTLG